MSQKAENKLVRIKTDDTLMETATHGTPLFPYKLYDENINEYDFNCIDWHWHTEFEFVYIESGMIHINVGEDNFDLSTVCSLLITMPIRKTFWHALIPIIFPVTNKMPNSWSV